MPELKLKPEHLCLLLEVLERHAPEAEVWAYGSRVNGGAHQGFDLDLVVRNPAGLDQPKKQLGLLRDGLSESDLPMLVEVLDWAWVPESFRRDIEQQHVIIRAAAAAQNLASR